ncbi:MAG: hypothetical protein MRJ92_12155 [Nitrospira sp.]|nr:hypothetical protein [Nitrospira sp.]
MIFNLRPLQYDKMELINPFDDYLKSYETQYHIGTTFSVTGTERFYSLARKSSCFGSSRKRCRTSRNTPRRGGCRFNWTFASTYCK